MGSLVSFMRSPDARAVVLSRADPYPVGGSRYLPVPRARFPDQPGLTGPLRIGDYAKIEAGAHPREYTVIGSNVLVKEGAFLHRAVVHNNVHVGQGVTLRGCVIGKNTDVMRLARIEEAAVVGDECVIEPEAYLPAGVKVPPFKTIKATAVVNNNVI
jgi:mannose-1-phosphate guanylyltransferase/phosphomannomutase